MLTYRIVDPASLGGGVLHPQMAADLKQAQDNPQPKLWQVPIDQVRAQARLEAAVMNRADVTTKRAVTRDMALTTPAAALPARLYSPPGAAPHPLWLFFHGGGFVLGSFDDYAMPYHRICLQTPCAILSVDYRLAPEHRFPTAVEDCIAAYTWVLENASVLGIDPSRVAVGGDSAGGNLTAALCLAARERGLPQPALQVLIYPTVDLSGTRWESYDLYSDYGLSIADMLWFRDQPTQLRERSEAISIHHLSRSPRRALPSSRSEPATSRASALPTSRAQRSDLHPPPFEVASSDFALLAK
ncbi:MAG: alpha/beta hydrolase [Anaerolineae bacterium]|nr:alpha/beta hydrolase [Anaerolineae bacterium]